MSDNNLKVKYIFTFAPNVTMSNSYFISHGTYYLLPGVTCSCFIYTLTSTVYTSLTAQQKSNITKSYKLSNIPHKLN